MTVNPVLPPPVDPPPGAPAHWAHMPWRARRKWWAEHAKDARAVPDVTPPDADLAEPPVGAHRAVVYVLTVGSTITPKQACEDLQLSARAVSRALERAGYTTAAAPYRSLYYRQRNQGLRHARSGLPPPADEEIAARRAAIDE